MKCWVAIRKGFNHSIPLFYRSTEIGPSFWELIKYINYYEPNDYSINYPVVKIIQVYCNPYNTKPLYNLDGTKLKISRKETIRGLYDHGLNDV